MLFTLRNLGRLEEATIDLSKDLIVLTGPNNTSKTYVAHAIYGFCLRVSPDLSGPLWTKLVENSKHGENHIEVDALEMIDRHLDEILGLMTKMYTSMLPEVLAAPQSFTAASSVVLEIDKEAIERGRADILGSETHSGHPVFGLGLEEQVFVDKLSGSGVWAATQFVRITGTRSSEERSSQAIRVFLMMHTTEALLHAFFGGITRPYIMTAERSSMEIFSRELAAQRFDSRGQDELLRPYPVALTESLKFVQRMSSAQNDASPYAAEADRLEREILQGRIDVGASGEMLFVPEGTTERLAMHLSSSSIKALAWLSFYLRHVAKKGDFLIIDEPELNLHPDNQRKVARFLARLSRSGIKVMLSTHSDHIVRELNNLIMLSSDKDGKLLGELGYTREETLDPAKVGAYLFTPRRANPVPVEPTGFDAATINAAIADENRVSQRIYYALFDK